jgi:hypothetical protein
MAIWVMPTQAEAIQRARELSPNTSPLVERVRRTSKGKPNQMAQAVTHNALGGL